MCLWGGGGRGVTGLGVCPMFGFPLPSSWSPKKLSLRKRIFVKTSHSGDVDVTDRMKWGYNQEKEP